MSSSEEVPEVHVLERQNAQYFPPCPEKRPVAPLSLFCDEELEESDVEDDALPDLEQFFTDHGVPMQKRVAMCRSYASWLSHLLPKKRRKIN